MSATALALLFSVEVAERFRDMYEAAAGRTVDPWWDVHAVLSYSPEWKQVLPIQIDGRAPLDSAGMASRMEDLLERALLRASWLAECGRDATNTGFGWPCRRATPPSYRHRSAW